MDVEENFLLTAHVSNDCKVIGIEHPTDANWFEVRKAWIALRDWLNERLANQAKCPFKPEVERHNRRPIGDCEGMDC